MNYPDVLLTVADFGWKKLFWRDIATRACPFATSSSWSAAPPRCPTRGERSPRSPP